MRLKEEERRGRPRGEGWEKGLWNSLKGTAILNG